MLTNTVFIRVLRIVFPFSGFLYEVEKRKVTHSIVDLLVHVIPLTFFIYWLLSNIPYASLLYLTCGTYLAARTHIARRLTTSELEKVKLVLWYFIVVTGGFSGLWNFVGHFFLADSVATSIGWLPGSQFQTELAFYHLGTAIAAFAAIWLKENLIEGIAVIKIVFLLGALYVHLRDILINQNHSVNNTGTVVVGDLIIPIILATILIMLIYYTYEDLRRRRHDL